MRKWNRQGGRSWLRSRELPVWQNELRAATGTMQCRKNVPNTSHFRTIAPKIAPKVVNACTPSSYRPPQPDIAVSGISTKPVVMPTQNYTLMKVAGQDGTFSLFALPQVTQPMGTQVIQTTNIPLQENLKLPIPRYQFSRNKTLLGKKTKGTSLNRSTEKKIMQVEHNAHSEIIPKLSVEEDIRDVGNILTPGTLPVKQADTIIHHSVPYTEKCLPKTFCSSSPIKFNAEENTSLVENGSLLSYESKKVANSTNSLAVLSQVMFGSPVRVVPSVPKGKLAILPYSKMKKTIISKSIQSIEKPATVADFSTKPPSHETLSSKVPNHISSVVDSSTLANPCLSGTGPDGDPLKKSNGAAGKKRGRKRKASSEIMGNQKMNLVGRKLVFHKEKLKMHSVEAEDKKEVSFKKYRCIMPKPVMVGQTLTTLGSATPGLQSLTTDIGIKNKVHQIKQHRTKPGDGFVSKQVGDLKSLSSAARACYKCNICEHSFQFKHHLQDHLNTHTNRKPYHCRLCRKAYVHSGSLSTHMKLHHGESRLKKLMCCEFCGKVFGHIKVYFGHLKEVHRVIISTETFAKQLEAKDTNAMGNQEASLIERESCFSSEEQHSINGQAGEIKLQIKCGRCHVFMPTFSDMKEHLLFEHGDKFEDRSQEGVLESRQGAQEEVVKNATHYWKLLNERRNVVKCSSCGEEFLGAGKLRKHTCFPHVNRTELLKRKSSSPKGNLEDSSKEQLCFSASGAGVRLWRGDHLNCILCQRVFGDKEELLTHWGQVHKCEDPLLLWAVFTSLPKKV
ncbi:hypothetical protein XENTR_v10015895 [Xenopus tropicalis]|uniref:Zinc finger protein 438 isoform X1 n=1 Tax=Xenopus tropicalis TaxID=8364 RepID=A0A8J0QS20_XENTR|nr:zinc finger protein 438 isoform X1 [Xenopus tropicalis]KAE8595867.1 hypothetical protein XENTR_v10015895 [Xenopus tropicalis]